MGNQRTTGLTKRGGVWHIDKVFRGTRIRESTATGDLAQAQEQLARRIDQIRTARVYGLRSDRTFRAAATRFLEENQHKKSIRDDAALLRQLDPFIGNLTLRQVHMGSLQPFIAKRRSDGVKTRSINNALALVRHILNLAAAEWRDEQGLTWLEYAPKIKLIPVKDGRAPYPLARDEQAMLFQELPDHLARMALFKVNTGCRVFSFVPKRGKAKPGEHQEVPTPVPVFRMNISAWKSARVRAADKWEEQTGTPAPEGFRRVRVHDLKHTFGRRLRAAGVSFEDRQDLLGHKSARITTHYSGPELSSLIAAAEKVCDDTKSPKVPTSICLRRKSG